MAGEKRVLTLGGKGYSLSSASVLDFSTASPPLLLKIDPSALAKLSSLPDTPFKLHLSVPDYMTSEEARASVLLLLYKILIVGGSLPASAACRLLGILNNNKDTRISSVDLDFDTQENVDMLRNWWPDITVHAICALLDYTANSLATVADVVAALSCDALEANMSTAFSYFKDSGDGFSDKDRASVVGDLKVLLNGSTMFAKQQQCDDVIRKIPFIHGRLRSLCKSVRSSTRVELNSIPFGNDASSEDLTVLFLSLAYALKGLGETSWLRAKRCLEKLEEGGNLYPSLVEGFDVGCPGVDKLKCYIKSAVAYEDEKSYIRAFHEIYSLSEDVRKILSWEATLCFISLEDTDGRGPAKLEKKKGSVKKVLGKGTNIFMQFLKNRLLQLEISNSVDNSGFPEKVAHCFLSVVFDLKDSGYEHMLQKVKDIVYSNESRRLPKIPKGTRDFAKEQTAVREKSISIVTNVYKRHGAMALETPEFELRETLTGKYGEDSKLIYDLADQGGELCSLRYDLTVPFARYVAMNGLKSFRRYQIGNVYRRDNPSNGKYRVFCQCDFDIAGDNTIGADFEVVKILTELLDELNIGEYEIKLNHRKLLDGMLDICGVPSNKFRTVCSSIDKLDKQSFEQIKMELIEEKGLDAATVERIGSFVSLRGHPLSLLSELKKEGSKFLNNDSSSQALNDLEKLFECLKRARCVDKVVLDLSLARGLDYYTGVIFEAVFKGATQVGSIAGGGRYDNLIGMFGSKTSVAAVGVSLGIERVFAIMEQNQKDDKQLIRASETQVLVSVLGDDTPLAAELVSMCWNTKLKARFLVHKRWDKHMAFDEELGIPWMVIVGDRGVEEGMVKIKDIEAKVDYKVPTSSFLDELTRLMTTPRPILRETPRIFVTKKLLYRLS